MNSSKRTRYTPEQVQEISAKLRELPAIKKKRSDYSSQDVVKMLSKDIVALQKRGYTLEQIANVLRQENLTVATPTLKNYLQRAKPGEREGAAGVGAAAVDGVPDQTTGVEKAPDSATTGPASR